MRKRALRAIAIGLASIAGALLIGEVVLRVQGYDRLAPLMDGRQLILRPSENPDIKYELTPGARGRAWRTNVAVNAYGLRGPEFAPERPRGRRVILLGDSITFGDGTRESATFAGLTRQALVGGFEVLNFGVGGYDTLQEVALLEERGLALRPDLVVLAYCLNDIGVVSINLQYIDRLDARRRNPLYRLRLSQFVADRFDRISLQGWLNERNRPEQFRRDYAHRIDAIGADETELLALMRGVPDLFPSSWYGDPARVGRLRHGLRRLGELAREHGFDAVVMIIPFFSGKPGDYPHSVAHSIVAAEARRAGLDVLDLTDAILAAGGERLRGDPHDPMHPGERGHAVIAYELRDYILGPRASTP